MKKKRGRPKKTVVNDPIPPPSPPPPPAPVTADDEAVFLNFVGQNVDENQFENENENSESVELNRNDNINDGDFVQFNTEREFSLSPGLPSSASDGEEDDESDDSESSLSISEEPVPRKRVQTVANKCSRYKKYMDVYNANIDVNAAVAAAVAASTVRGGSVAGAGLSSKAMSSRGGGGAFSSMSRKQLSQIGKRPTQDPRYDKKSLETALSVIKKVMKMDEAVPFNHPVDPVALGIPDYFRVVDVPMDFGTICSNLENCVKYMNSNDVYKDVEHIWDNCRKSNKRGDYTMYLMKIVKKKFMKYWKAAGLRSGIPMNHNGHSHIPEPSNMLHDMERQNHATKHPVAPMVNGSAHSHKQPQPSSQLRQSEWCMRQPRPSQSNIGGDTNNAGNWRFHPMDGLTTHGSVPRSSMGPSLSSMNQQHVPNHSRPNERHPPRVTTAQHQSSCTLQPSQPLGSANIFSSGIRQMEADHSEKRNMQMYSANPGADIASLPGSSLSQQPLAKHSQVHKVKPSALVKKRKIESRRLLGNLQDGEKIHVPINKLGQPVGPEAAKLASFLGIVSRDCNIAPLNYLSWHSMPEANKEEMWQSVQTKFDIDPNCKKWVMMSIASKWRDWKATLKSNHYNPHTMDEERLRDCNERVHPDQWAALVAYWNTEKMKILCANNRARRLMQKTSHATGSKSFARLREEEQAKRSDGKELTRAELYILTRTRKDGNPVNETAAEMITKLREAKNQQNSDGSNGYADTFCQVMGEDKPSQVGPSPHEGRKPGHVSLMSMAISANEEVKKMTNRMEAMEKRCAALEAQIATMSSCMQSLIDKKDASSSKQVSNHDPEDLFESQEQSSSSSHAMED